jgi:type II secretory pathway component PulK
VRPADRGGFALVAVLWVLVLASALALELHAVVLADQRAAANARAHARAQWAARGGFARAEDALRTHLEARAAAGARPATDTLLVPALAYALEGVSVHARVVDARAKVQLNLAAEGELRTVFAAAGLAPERAAAAARAVAAWRAEHAAPAAPADTLAASLLPPPGAFSSLDALRAVVGVGEEERALVSPYLTVASDGRINVNTAPEPVLRTLPGVGAEAAAAIAARRREEPFASVHEVLDAVPRSARGPLQGAMAAFEVRAAFAPAQAEVVAEAAPEGSPVTAAVRGVAVFGGARRYVIVNVVSR